MFYLVVFLSLAFKVNSVQLSDLDITSKDIHVRSQEVQNDLFKNKYRIYTKDNLKTYFYTIFFD
jgi:hypothetical protein